MATAGENELQRNIARTRKIHPSIIMETPSFLRFSARNRPAPRYTLPRHGDEEGVQRAPERSKYSRSSKGRIYRLPYTISGEIDEGICQPFAIPQRDDGRIVLIAPERQTRQEGTDRQWLLLLVRLHGAPRRHPRAGAAEEAEMQCVNECRRYMPRAANGGFTRGTFCATVSSLLRARC